MTGESRPPGTTLAAPGSPPGPDPGDTPPPRGPGPLAALGVPAGDSCAGCSRLLRTGDVEFGVERHGIYHVACSPGIPGDATIATVGVFVERRHLVRMPGSARKRVARARLLVPQIVKTLMRAGKIDGAEETR